MIGGEARQKEWVRDEVAYRDASYLRMLALIIRTNYGSSSLSAALPNQGK